MLFILFPSGITNLVVLVVVLNNSSEPLSCPLSPVYFDTEAYQHSGSANEYALTVLVDRPLLCCGFTLVIKS